MTDLELMETEVNNLNRLVESLREEIQTLKDQVIQAEDKARYGEGNYECGCRVQRSTKIKAFCDDHYMPIKRESDA